MLEQRSIPFRGMLNRQQAYFSSQNAHETLLRLHVDCDEDSLVLRLIAAVVEFFK